MNKIFSVERIEGNLAVCISDDEEQVTVPVSALPDLKARDVFSADFDGESITNVIPLPEERDRRITVNRERLRRIIEKNGK
jgi:hypothetical protein